jgi:hypothetical protein
MVSFPTRVEIAFQRSEFGRAHPETRFRAAAIPRASPLPAWLALIGLVLPVEVQLFIAGAKFTSGRICVSLLLIPAVFKLCLAGRRLLVSDSFAFVTAAWMVGANVSTDGLSSLSSTGAEALEFLGGYVVARGLFFGFGVLRTFVRVLTVLSILCILFGMADSISGRYVVHNAFAAILHTSPPGGSFRGNMIRAMSTFDHPILFGVFCSLIAAIMLYSKEPRRFLYVGFCVLGCYLSQSSAALTSITIIILAYTYDQVTREYPWRWTAVWAVVVSLVVGLCLTANHPLDWAINHLTLDPSSGWYRKLIWDAALDKIPQSPLTGFAFNKYGDEVLDNTIDCVWLVYALRFGVPTITFLFLTNLTALLPVGQSFRSRSEDENYMVQMRTAFSMVLVMFMFIGLTVHFWNYMWIFWSICLGIRASLREYFMTLPNSMVSFESTRPPQTHAAHRARAAISLKPSDEKASCNEF